MVLLNGENLIMLPKPHKINAKIKKTCKKNRPMHFYIYYFIIRLN